MNMSKLVLSSNVAKPFTLGAMAVDRRLGHGLTRGALHEVYARDADGPAAIAFGLLLATRSAPAKPIIVVRDERCVRAFGRLYGAGVVDLGIDPAGLIVIHTIDALTTLRAAADAVVCSDIGAVIVEPWRASPIFDLTASRRIALRAERSGVLTVVLRIGIDPTPSAAATRWQVCSAQSIPLPTSSPGQSSFVVNLLRHRGGIAGFEARVEWNRDQRSFRDSPHPRAVPAVAAGGTRDAGARRAA